MTTRHPIMAGIMGTVAQLHAEDGAHLEANDKLLEIECMKVYYGVHAPAAGIVRFHVELGQVVGQDDIVAIIEGE